MEYSRGFIKAALAMRRGASDGCEVCRHSSAHLLVPATQPRSTDLTATIQDEQNNQDEEDNEDHEGYDESNYQPVCSCT